MFPASLPTRIKRPRLGEAFTYLLLLCLLILLAGCGGGHGGADHSDNTTRPPELNLSQTRGAPGSIVIIQGYDGSQCAFDQLAVSVAGEAVMVMGQEQQQPAFAIPLFYDSTTQWANPPTTPVDIRLDCNGSELKTFSAAFTVAPLPRAPGTTRQLVTDFSSQVSTLQEIVGKLDLPVSLQTQHLYAYLHAMADVLEDQSSDSVSTLLQALADEHPDTLALMDAVNAASGQAEKIDQFYRLLQAFNGALDNINADMPVTTQQLSPAGSLPYVPQWQGIQSTKSSQPSVNYLPIYDRHLAFMMQLYHMLNLFQREVVSNVASGFANIATGVGVVAGVPQVAMVNAMLGTYDLIMKKLVLSLMPARLDRIDLRISPTTIGPGEDVPSSIYVYASNLPEPTTLTDITAMILDELGTPPGNLAWVTTLRESVERAALQYIGILNSYLTQYAQYNQGNSFDYDMNLFSMVPQLHFQARAVSRKLYKLNSFPVGTDIVSPMTYQVGWRAGTTAGGTVRLWLMPASDNDARLISSFLGAEYLGGAFGVDTLASNRVEVAVGDFSVNINASDCMHDSDNGKLEVVVGNTASNGFAPRAGVDVTINILGGAATGALTQITAPTDADGKVSIDYTADPTVTDVSFDVTVTNPTDGTSIIKRHTTAVQNHCGLAIELELPDCLQKDESADATIIAGEPNAQGGIDGYGNIDLAFSLARGEINNGIGIGSTDNQGRMTVPIVPDSDTGSMDLKVMASDSEGLYAEKLVTIPIVCTNDFDIVFSRRVSLQNYELHRLTGTTDSLIWQGSKRPTPVAWSPDNSKILFASNNSFIVANVDGSGVVYTTAGVAYDSYAGGAWSEDGSSIMLVRLPSGGYGDPGFSVDKIDLSTGNSVLINEVSSGSEPAFSHDGILLAYSRYEDPVERSGNLDIYRSTVDGGSLMRLTTAIGEDWFPIFSPSDNNILYRHTDDSTGEETWRLIDQYGVDRSLISNADPRDRFGWSQDETKLAYAQKNGSRAGDIYMIDFNSNQTTQLTSGSPTDTSPVWSLDDQKIIFSRDGDLYSIHSDGTGLKQLTSGAAADNHLLERR